MCVDGFFDAGMLLNALKKEEGKAKPGDQAARRRDVGRKLQLMEY